MSLLAKLVPETLTLIELALSCNNIFSEYSLTILPISFIDFLGTIPVIFSEIPSFSAAFAKARR